MFAGHLAEKTNELYTYGMDLSVAIVNYKTPDLTKKLLKSLEKERLEIDIVVLDNGSEDEVEKVVNEQFPQVKFIQNRNNTGFSKGYNKAIAATKGDYILILNSDIEVQKGSLKKLLEAVKSYGGRAIVVGKLILPDGSIQKSAFHLPTITGAVKEYFLGIKDKYFSYLPNQHKHSEVEGAIMACFLIPREIWEQTGKLDEGTELYFEDIEYCKRLKQAKIPIYYIPQAVFNHRHGASSKKLPEGEILKKLQKAAKRYHGLATYFTITFVLWLGQKIRHND